MGGNDRRWSKSQANLPYIFFIVSSNSPSFSHWVAEEGADCQQLSPQVHWQDYGLEHEVELMLLFGGLKLLIGGLRLLVSTHRSEVPHIESTY